MSNFLFLSGKNLGKYNVSEEDSNKIDVDHQPLTTTSPHKITFTSVTSPPIATVAGCPIQGSKSFG